MLYLTISSLQSEPGGLSRCLCGARVIHKEGAAYFDCPACLQRWYGMAPGLMLQRTKEAIVASHQ